MLWNYILVNIQIFLEKKNNKLNWIRINKAAKLVQSILDLTVMLDMDLIFENVKDISQIDEILELNVGHFLIGHSLYTGLKDTILKFMKIIDHPKSK